MTLSYEHCRTNSDLSSPSFDMHSSQFRFDGGLDIGFRNDRSALAIVESVLPDRFFEDPSSMDRVEYRLGHLERFERGTPFTEVVRRVAETCRHPLFYHNVELAVDATGQGLPLVELLEAQKLRVKAVIITGGEVPSREDKYYRIPKAQLVTNLEILLEQGRLKIASDLPGFDLLHKELRAFSLDQNPDSGHVSFGARSGEHDDLLTAVLLAAWFASHRPRPGRVSILRSRLY